VKTPPIAPLFSRKLFGVEEAASAAKVVDSDLTEPLVKLEVGLVVKYDCEAKKVVPVFCAKLDEDV